MNSRKHELNSLINNEVLLALDVGLLILVRSVVH